jgi:hypothetical protein
MNINKLVALSVVVSSFVGGHAALAQTAGAPAGPEGAAAAPVQPAPAEPAAPAQAAPANPQVVAFVDSQFPAADADANGTLTAAEFTSWISKLKTAELEKAGQPADAAAVKAYADNALLTADADKDGTITKAELVKFFGG